MTYHFICCLCCELITTIPIIAIIDMVLDLLVWKLLCGSDQPIKRVLTFYPITVCSSKYAMSLFI